MCGHSTGVIVMILSCKLSKRKSEIQDGGFEKNSVVQISAYTHDSNEIPMATPMFPGPDNTVRLLGIMSYVNQRWRPLTGSR